jgi:hypothetical protein
VTIYLVLEALTAIHLLASAGSIASVRKADKCKSFGLLRFSVSRQEDPDNAPEPFEQVPELLLFRQFAHLGRVRFKNHKARKSYAHDNQGMHIGILTFVTLSVARSSLSYLPPILSPAPAPPFRK